MNINKTNSQKRTYKMPETTIQEHLIAKAQSGDYKAKDFLQKSLRVKEI